MAADATEPLFLAAPGDAVWGLLATPRTIEELVDEMTSRFDGDRGAIAADVDAFVAELERQELVRR